MLGCRGVQLAKLGHTEIWLDASWAVLLPFLAWALATRYFPLNYPVFGPTVDWALGVAGAGALLAVVLLHEVAHLGAGRALGLAPARLDVLVFGAAACPRCTAPGAEVLVAAAGTAASVVAGALTFWAALNAGPFSRPLEAFLGYLAIANLLLALLHLLPGWPLDGGRVLRAVLLRLTHDARPATRAVVVLGLVAGICLALAGAWQFWVGSVLPGVSTVLVGALVAVAAARSAKQS